MMVCLFLKQHARSDLGGVEGVWTRAILSNNASTDLVGNTPDPATITYPRKSLGGSQHMNDGKRRRGGEEKNEKGEKEE
jgi:hypothetical protein